MSKNTERTLYEYDEQRAIFSWAKHAIREYPDLWMLNSSLGGVRLTIGQGKKAKRAGYKPGFPDIFLPVVTVLYSGLFVELKRIKGGSVSPEQRKWIAGLSEQGYKAIVCRGAIEAINAIKEYLGDR